MPTVLKAPTSVPTPDPDMNVSNSAQLFPEQEPVAPAAVESDYPESDTNEIFDLVAEEGEDEVEALRRGAPAAPAGTFRDSFFSKVVREWATDPLTLINRDLESRLQVWLKDLIELHATLESSVQDLGNAITENGAKITFDIVGIKKIGNEFVWIRKIAELADILKVSEYRDGVILRDLEQTFGRSKDSEEEAVRKAQAKDQRVQLTALKLLQGIHSALSKPEPASAVPASVFKPAGRRSKPAAPQA